MTERHTTGAFVRRSTTTLRVTALTLFLVIRAAPGPSAEPASSPAPTPADAKSPGLFEATSHRSFADVEFWRTIFDDPARDAWQRPSDVVAAVRIRPGMTVADLGAGTGYFSRYLAAAVGQGGTVLAVETEPKLVEQLRTRAEQERTSNVTPILASFDNPRLPASGVDRVLIVDTFHHLDARLGYLERLKRCLKPGGRITIIDWQKHDLPVGPPPEHKIARDQVVEEMSAAGYVLVEEPDVLPYQYVLVFEVRGR